MSGEQSAEAKEDTRALNLWEASARVTLQKARRDGHPYVELRNIGKRIIFLCTLCHAQCFNERVLFDHLDGKFHARRCAVAMITLFGPNPWPFSDGFFFFKTSWKDDAKGDKVIPSTGGTGLADSKSNSGRKDADICEKFSDGQVGVSEHKGKGGDLLKDVAKAQFIGYGHIGARVQESDEGERSVGRIWCGWLGQEASDDCSELLKSPKCDFAILSFSCTHDLGKKEPLKEAFFSGSFFEIDELGRLRKRPTPRRFCEICCQEMLTGKDVSTLLNCNTGKLACSSRNEFGAFHLWHTSCLLHWILLCESATWSQAANVETSTGGQKAKRSEENYISILCPACQGTGKNMEGDELEQPTVSIKKIFFDKLKLHEAHRTWMKNPEDLKKCSTGLHFSSHSLEELQGKVMHLKLLRFYRAAR